MMPAYSYNPTTDITDLSGKVILVTGGTAGLGAETIIQLSRHNPRRIIFTGRNAVAADKVIHQVRTESSTDIQFVSCEFTSLRSVHDAGKKILQSNDRLDVLMCNAGVMAIPKGLTKDGYEIQFGINHLAHALLIKSLLPLLVATAKLPDADVRIVSNTSQGAFFARTLPFDKFKTTLESPVLGAFHRYGYSKMANILYAKQLAKHYPQITSVAIHPGVIYTGLVGGLDTFNKAFTQATTFWRQISVEDGVKNQLWAATSNDKIVNGEYYEPVGQIGNGSATTHDEKLAAQLWEWTDEQLMPYQ